MTKTKSRIDFTTGGILYKLIIFTLPIMATNLLQTFYNAADMMIVSLSDEANAVGAVGTTGAYTTLLVSIFIGFSIGSNVTIARHIGARDKEAAESAVHTAVLLSVIFGVAACLVGVFGSRAILIMMGNRGNILELATRYAIIYSLGLPFISMTNFFVSILRARGDSKTPLIVLSISGISNVLMNLFFVLVLGMSVEGVALATLFANVISTSVLFVILTRSDDYTKISLKKLRLSKRECLDILYIGLPSAIQSACISISNMAIQSSVVRLDNNLSLESDYNPIINGHAAQTNLDNFVYTAMHSVAIGTTSYTSQNAGSRDVKRIKKGLYVNYAFVSMVGLTLVGAILLLHEPLVALYGIERGAEGSASEIAYKTALMKATNFTLLYWICGLYDIGAATMRALGRSIFPFLVTFFGMCVFRVFWVSLIFPINYTYELLLLSYPISWIATSIISFIGAIVAIRALQKRIDAKKEANV